METKQYYHKIFEGSKGGVTYCVDLDKKCSELYEAFLNNTSIEFMVGKAICSREDFYIKKTGRKLSSDSSRMKSISFLSRCIEIDNKRHIITLYDPLSSRVLIIGISKRSEKPHLLWVY